MAGTDYTAGGSIAYGTAITYPADNMMSRDGFDFTGWSSDATTMPDEDLTITAQWATAAAKYDITFSKGVYTAYDGAVSFPEGENASNVTLAELSSDNSYRFDGWKASEDVKQTTIDGSTITADTRIDAGTKVFVTQNTTFTAQWKEKHAVTFNSNGGSAVTTQYVVDGETAEEPTDPTRTNYTFGGWQLSGSAYNFSTEVDEAITLDATWSRNEISDTETDVVISSGTTVNTGGTLSVSVSPSLSTKEGGVKFGGNITSGSDNPTRYIQFTIPSGSSATVKTLTVASNNVIIRNDIGGTTLNEHVFYVSDNLSQYNKTLTTGTYYIGRGGSTSVMTACTLTVTSSPLTVTLKVAGQADQVINVTSGETLGNIFVSGELPTPSVAGYTFNGWKNQANDATVTKATVISGSMVIYADLTGEIYDITLNKGTNGTLNGAATATMGETSLSITTAAEGASGYALIGYFTAADNDVKVAETDGALVASIDGWTDSDGKWVKTSDATLYAQWEALAAPTAMTITGAGSYAKNAEATLTVTEVDGAPIPTIAWYSSNADGSELSEDPVETGTTYSPSTATAGKFYFVAKATNSQGTFTSDVQTITVKPAAPTISADATFNFANKGYAVTLTNKEATGDLKIKIGSADWANYAAAIYATTTTSYQAKVVVNGAESDVVSLEVTNTFDPAKSYVAWVYESNYKNAPDNYNVANDEIYKSLKTIYNVVLVDIKDYNSSITDKQKAALNGNLDDADLVFISEAAAGGGKGMIALKDLVGNVPVLNMKIWVYTYNSTASKNRWGWGTLQNEATTIRAITPISKKYKLWNGVEFAGDSIILFSGSESQSHIQTIKSWQSSPSGNVNMSYAYGTSNVTMHASNSLKYFALGISCDDYANYNQNAITIVKNAAAMLLAGEDLDDEALSVSGKITPAGWASFSSSYPLDLSTLSNGTAYYASAAGGDEVTLSRISSSVPSGEGLMIKGTAGDTFTIDVAASGTAISGNKLIGLPGGGEVVASIEGKNHYVFGYESSSVYGFYNLASALTVPAGKAYLELTDALTTGESSAAGRLRIVVEENTTTTLDNLGGEETAVKFFQNGQLYIKRNGIVYDAMGHIVVR